ncbi:hypothetical protein OG585_15420 [Streptomyces sp. NBC_01340]|uniref:hypothetical protein n=1 Tax=unclassified Streptomyces TaxID=2593676 RepID=UPI00224DB86A|nr:MULTISPECIES: hypothetical protein [unclassified Streptomyces]MCX4454072.1 hypothetical protein [Streptomyces sp. NBC_01719]MCX4493432.1 hypothetical protein [Streptomyces sp. NBC_01728]WSI38556.1 hypothetical protein OG585_15420 [Streptomyces sp. NBC_01340]
MTKPTTSESASEAMARHEAAMAQRERALKLMARQAARKAEADKAKPDRRRKREKPARSTKQPLREIRVGTSVRTVSGGLPSLGKRR